jgi:hypothetical protein
MSRFITYMTVLYQLQRLVSMEQDEVWKGLIRRGEAVVAYLKAFACRE